MILAEKGKISQDSSIAAYLDDVPGEHRNITVRQLLSHTAGLAEDHYDFMKLSALAPVRYTVKQQLQDLYEKKLLTPPGTKFSYSDAGFFLLAALIEKISGESYNAFVAKNIFEPASMHSSSFLNGDSIVPDLSQGYTFSKNVLVRFSLDPAIQSLDANGFADIISTTGDLMRWMVALSAGKIIKEETFRNMLTPTLLPDGRKQE